MVVVNPGLKSGAIVMLALRAAAGIAFGRFGIGCRFAPAFRHLALSESGRALPHLYVEERSLFLAGLVPGAGVKRNRRCG
jgi:hypothetical protein